MSAPHISVMLPEVLDALSPLAGAHVIDGTFGAGGYSRAFIAAGARVTAFDRDPSAARFADLDPSRFTLIRARFSQMAELLGDGVADGVALDLGVSSMQLDEAERGFSFMRDGDLDMRMSSEGVSAADLVNTAEHGELARIFKVYGEEREAGRVATAILRRRVQAPFTRTLDLAEVVERALGGRRGAKIHPATRVFQGLRMAVNEEVEELEAGLRAAERVLKPGARLAVVSFHSGEDRVVKAFLAERSGKLPGGSRHAPPVEATRAATFRPAFNGARAASADEAHSNPRSRSAKLRAAIRTEAPAWRAAA